MGDLKLVERPQNYTLGPGAQQAIRRARLATPLPLSYSSGQGITATHRLAAVTRSRAALRVMHSKIADNATALAPATLCRSAPPQTHVCAIL